MIAVCNLCKPDQPYPNEPFRVPWDEMGRALMWEHLKEEHPDIELKDAGNLVRRAD